MRPMLTRAFVFPPNSLNKWQHTASVTLMRRSDRFYAYLLPFSWKLGEKESNLPYSELDDLKISSFSTIFFFCLFLIYLKPKI